jgi:hypothetical protein
MIRFCALIGAFIVLFFALPAAAQDDSRADRFGFDDGTGAAPIDPFLYDGQPVEAGGFRLWPNLTFEQAYTDNVLAGENNRQSDFVSILRPHLRLEKAFGRHHTGLEVQGEARRFWQHGHENEINAGATLRALVEARRSLRFPLRVDYVTDHADRKTQRQPLQADLTREPLEHHKGSFGAGVVYQPGRLALSLLGGYEEQRFEDGVLAGGGPAVRRDGDFNAAQAEIKISYETGTGWQPYVAALYRRQDYLRRAYTGTGFSGMSRNHDMARLRAGLSFDYKGLLYGFFETGHESRDYEDPAAQNTAGLSLAGHITWEPAQTLRLSLGLAHDTEEDSIARAAIEKTSGDLRLDYEIRHNIFARLQGGYESEEFIGIARHDDTVSGGLELRAILSPRLQLGAGYLYESRDSSATGASYGENVLMLRLTGAL